MKRILFLLLTITAMSCTPVQKERASILAEDAKEITSESMEIVKDRVLMHVKDTSLMVRYDTINGVQYDKEKIKILIKSQLDPLW